MSSLRDVYTYSGTFDSELWFLYLYGVVPSRYEYEVKGGEMIDFSKFEFNDDIKQFFRGGPYKVREYSYTVTDLRDTDKEEIDFSKMDTNDSIGGSFCFTADEKVIFITGPKVQIFYDAEKEDLNNIRDIAKKIYDICPKEEPEEKKSTVGLIKVYNGDYYTDTCKIKEVEVNIEETYNDDFVPVDKDIREFLKSDNESGIILLYGTYGSGNFFIKIFV